MNFKNILITGCMAALLLACGNNEKKESNTPETQTANVGDTLQKENTVEPSAPDPVPQTSTSPAEKLQGSWEIVRATGTAASTNVGTVYTFEGESLTQAKDGFSNPGKTEITDSTFSFQTEKIKYKFMYDYKFDGDTLVVSMQNSNGQMLYMLKK
ncbi:MAG TPA: hypothetical protein VFV31_10810 [Chitinophagaceae bacterium]|nr:hypothetical protein [Chitinophagaceae bacterium]